MHSMTGRKSIEVFFRRNISTNSNRYEQDRQENIDKLREKQKEHITQHNEKRKSIKTYTPVDIVIINIRKGLG